MNVNGVITSILVRNTRIQCNKTVETLGNVLNRESFLKNMRTKEWWTNFLMNMKTEDGNGREERKEACQGEGRDTPRRSHPRYISREGEKKRCKRRKEHNPWS